MTRLVQIQKGRTRAVALVEEPRLRLLDNAESVFQLAQEALDSRIALSKLVKNKLLKEFLDYENIYSGKSDWKILPPIDHPEPARCLVSGTGLTHLGSAKNRQAMHAANRTELNDSMKMFKLGAEGGKPARGKIGIAPEWFYKGNGTILRAHNEPLEIPAFGEDGGEEGEIAGIYLVDRNGNPRRIGMAIGNEFSDHIFEKKNYLNLAGSKIRTCAIGPEIVIDPRFDSVSGVVKILRGKKTAWSCDILTGEDEMCHNLPNIEHHHFKFATHRRPGDTHVHFFGACSLSFGAGVKLAGGDIMEIGFAKFGRALRNPLQISRAAAKFVSVKSLD